MKKLFAILSVSFFAVTAFASTFPKIDHWQLGKTPVYFVKSTRLPFVVIQTSFRAGSAYDGNPKGLALLTGSLLDQGAGNLSANQIADQLSDIGASVGEDVGQDKATVSLTALTFGDDFTTAFQTYLSVLGQPNFPKVQFDRLKAQQMRSLQFEKQYPGSVANRAFAKAVYGNTPYGTPTIGTMQSVQAITLKEIKAFYKHYYVRQNAVITIVGDISKHNAEYLSAAIASNLGSGKLAKLPYANQGFQFKSNTVQKNMPVKQTTLLMGLPTLAVGDKRFYAATVGNRILGSGQNSLLYRRVRSDNGLAYSVSSGFRTKLSPGPFVISAQTENQDANKTKKLIQATLTNFLSSGPTNKQLAQAKAYILGSYQMAFNSNAATAGLLTRMAFYGLPLDYFEQYPHHIKQVTKADVKKVMNSLIQPNNLSTIQVGGA